MSDKENKETTEAEDEMIEAENSEEEPSNVEIQPKDDRQDGEGDTNKPLSVAEYLNPPERKWVLPTFLGMLVVFCSYYWCTYVNLF